MKKEYFLRDCRDFFSRENIADEHREALLPVIVKGHRSPILRALDGVDMQLQRNKATNLKLAAAKLDGLVIKPGQTFSFWRTIGKATAEAGYLEGLFIKDGKLGRGVGGGLCQMANLINWMVLNSPLTITELHHHSDALFPDAGRRVPFGTGTGVFYKNIDYRFRNDTDQTVQLHIWIEDWDLCGELRAQKPFACRYRIVERGSGYVCENGVWYRVSRVYQQTLAADGSPMSEKLVLNNHSRVLFDYAKIPREEILSGEAQP